MKDGAAGAAAFRAALWRSVASMRPQSRAAAPRPRSRSTSASSAEHLLARVGAERAERDGALLRLALADDEQIGDLGEAVLAHLVVDLLVAEVGLDAQAPAARSVAATSRA